MPMIEISCSCSQVLAEVPEQAFEGMPEIIKVAALELIRDALHEVMRASVLLRDPGPRGAVAALKMVNVADDLRAFVRSAMMEGVSGEPPADATARRANKNEPLAAPDAPIYGNYL